MLLRDHLETTGQTLFRRRGWLPLVVLLAVPSAFAAFDTLADSVAERRLHVDPLWAWVWAAAVVFFVGVRILKKKTQLLEAPDRS